jgi:hypothetical protein
VALKDHHEGVWHCPERILAIVYKESRGRSTAIDKVFLATAQSLLSAVLQSLRAAYGCRCFVLDNAYAMGSCEEDWVLSSSGPYAEHSFSRRSLEISYFRPVGIIL